MSEDKSVVEEPWSPITKEERILHETLFYSQGPVDGNILGEGIRDLLLKSGLSLTVLSQIWNLADVSNDNVLNVQEFVLIMYLIREVKGGRPIPKTLPRSLVPPKTTPQVPPPMSQQEKDAYLRVFQTLDYKRAGFIDTVVAAEMFLSTKLPSDLLTQIWDLSEFARDGKLSPEKFAIACHLLRHAKRGGSLEGPVDIFQYAPQLVSPLSLLARKRRVLEYEEHKQRLMSLKERRKLQAIREAKRFDLTKQKVECLENLCELLHKLDNDPETLVDLHKTITKDKTDNEKQEEIALRLKKEHEKVRQETVKIILGEQKFNSDISIIKKDTDVLNKRLMSVYTHATRDPDPFHQLYEQRKEKRQGSTIKDLDKIDIYIPFEFSPFDLSITPANLPSGAEAFSKRANQKHSIADVKSVIADLKEFGDEFMDLWGGETSASIEKTKEFEDDEIFREVHDWSADNWPGSLMFEKVRQQVVDPQVTKIIQKLSDIRQELTRLSSEGGRLVFRNAEDYHARKKALEEEEKIEKVRVHRRSVTEKLRTNSTGVYRWRDSAHSHTTERPISFDSSRASQVAREYLLKRRSQTYDSGSSSPETLRNLERERRLYKPQTDQSISDDCSLSRESSLSSFDQPVFTRGTHKLEEESSTVLTRYSSRTDDSGILTSTSEREDINLELTAELSTESCTNATRTKKSVSPTETGNLEIRTSIEETLTVEIKSLLPKSSELLNRENQVCNNSINSEKDTATSQITTRKSSKKNKAPVPPSPSLSTAPNLEKTLETDVSVSTKNSNETTAKEKSSPLESSSKNINNNFRHNTWISTDIDISSKDKQQNSYPPGEKADINDSTHSPLKTEATPRRPPRLKKQKATSESFNDTVTPTIFSPAQTTSPDKARDVNDCNKSDIFEFGHNLDEANVSVDSNIEILPKQKSDIVNLQSDRQTCLHNTPIGNLPELDKECASHLSTSIVSSAHTTKDINKKEIDNREGQQDIEQSKDNTSSISSTFLNFSSNSDLEKATDRMTEVDRFPIKSQTKTTILQTNLVSPNTITLNERSAKSSVDIDKYNTDSIDHTLAVHMETVAAPPPPLPNSAPPPLPSTSQPQRRESSSDVDEEIVIVEYTVPITLAPDNNMNNVSSDNSFTLFNDSTISLDSTNEGTNTEHKQISPSKDKKDIETNKEASASSSSKTVSDLRSDFFGLKTKRSNKETLESELLETLTSTPFDSNSKDFQKQISLSTRFSSSVNSDGFNISQVNDGSLESVGDGMLFKENGASNNDIVEQKLTSTYDKKLSTASSTNRNIFPNVNTDLTSQSSLSQTSTASNATSQRSKNDDDDATTTTTYYITQNITSATKPSVSHLPPKIPDTEQPIAAVTLSNTPTTNSDKSSSSVKKEKSTESNKEHGNNLQPSIVADKSKKTGSLKKKIVVRASDANSSVNLTDMELERQEVISQSIVTKKVNSIFFTPVQNQVTSPTMANTQEFVPTSGKSLKSSNPSEYGFVYSAERPKPAPEVGWIDKQGSEQKVNIYSENVIKEHDTTESVDRESIADLSSTKLQWENIFTSNLNQGDTSTLKKKSPPKWAVRLPYTEKHQASPSNNSYCSPEEPEDNSLISEEESNQKMFHKPVVTESAIEREIRLAHEREEMLRKEVEERQKILEKQKNQTIMASYTTASAESDSNQPTAYNELTEADRHPDLWRAEQKDRRSDQEKEVNDINPNESIIEREIRLQREREAEIARMRKQLQPPPQPQRQDSSQSRQQYTAKEEIADINHNEKKTVSHEAIVNSSSNEVENRIIRELQELKEREEEIKRLHRSQLSNQIDKVDGQKEINSPDQRSGVTLSNYHDQPSRRKDSSSYNTPHQKESAESSSNQNTGRLSSDIISTRHEIKVRPIADSDDEDQRPNYFQKQETPIAKEMRLARDRENELRKQKGLPVVDNDDENNPYTSYNADSESGNSVSKPRSYVQSDDSLKKYASTRLQQELQEQKEREIALLKEGKIITTSEQHIQPLKFMEISVAEKNDGTLKRNYVTKKTSSSHNESVSPAEHQEVTSPTGLSAKKAIAVGSGGQLFSFRESRQKAESIIERELREMKEREEELKKQRMAALSESSQ